MDEQTYSGTFFRDLLHELNDPLAAVSGGLEAWESLDNERRDRLQPALLRNAQIMKKMLRDVGRYLALAQAGADEASSFTLSECVERSLEECEAAFESRRHQVETEVPSIRLTTKTGEENFRLLITSMLLTLSRSCPAEKTIRLSFRVENESSLLISSQAEYRGARLVQSDFRLTVLKELVEREGATLITTTDPIPRLEIALNCRVEASELEEEENGSATVSRHRVLVVDDNRDGAETLSLWLTAQGYETQVAFEGDEAEEKFDRWSPDVIILDIGLPGRSGYELAQDFRSRGYQGMLIALTGYGQERDRTQALESGFDHHLVKPANFSLLASLLKESESVRRRNVLLVEDNLIAAKVTAAVLESLGCRVTSVGTAREGLEEIKATCYDLILCDLGLPGEMDGFDFMREFAKWADSPQRSVVVAVTGGATENRAAALEAGFHDVLSKPLSKDTLKSLLSRRFVTNE